MTPWEIFCLVVATLIVGGFLFLVGLYVVDMQRYGQRRD